LDLSHLLCRKLASTSLRFELVFIHPTMQEQEPSSLKARLLFKAVDRLSGHRNVDSLPPLQRRKTTGGRASVRHQSQKPENQRRASYQAPPLVFGHLPPRTRCLTPPPTEREPALCPKASDQAQSLLFTLPKEILMLIYREVVGDKLIHIVRRQHKLGHTICCTSGDPGECRDDQCRGFKIPTGTYVQTGEAYEDSIQLLQTCRKM
jgi:hypothetical protein